MTRAQQIMESTLQAARVCEATGTPWGRAMARGFRASVAIVNRGGPAMLPAVVAIRAAIAREDWAAVVALADEHDPSHGCSEANP